MSESPESSAGPEASEPPGPSAWSRCLHHIAEAGDRLAAQLRDRGEVGAEVEASVTVLGVLMFGYLNHVWAEPEHPRFLPGAGFYTHVGTPSPDTIYRSAAIDGSGVYRLSGDRGTVADVSVMPFGAPNPQGLQTFPPFEFADLDVGPDGRFEVTLSVERPAGHVGNWWQLDAQMRSLMLRSVSAEWGRHREPTVAIVRLDTSPRRTRPPADVLARKFEGLALMVERSASYGLAKVDRLVADGVVNAVTLIDYSANGGLAGQYYHEGVFDLGDDEALLVEVALSPGCEFSIALTDRVFCTIDWTHAQASLNHTQATVDGDGVLRFVVAHHDPGVANWLDTTGYRRGVHQCRWLRCDGPPAPTVRVVSRSEVVEHLPAGTARVTPTERAEALRARNASAQLRSLW